MASFVPQQEIQETRALAEQVQISPDFTSFVADIALGLSGDELAARLNVIDGRARRPDGDFFYVDGFSIREDRRATADEADVLTADQRYRSRLLERDGFADDFLSFGEQVLSGSGPTINRRTELAARLNVIDGRARKPDGDFFYIDQMSVRESRQTTPQQSEALLQLFDLRAESAINDRGLRNLSSFYSDVNSRRLSNPTELAARLNVRNGYARKPDGDYFYIDRASVREDRTVGEPDGQMLREDLSAINEVVTLGERATDYQSFLTDLVSGRITSSRELTARLNPRNGYAQNPDGSPFYIDRFSVRETRVVDGEQARGLNRACELLGATGRYRQDLTSELLSGGDGSQVLERINDDYETSMVAGDAQDIDAEREAVLELARQWRRCNVDVQVLETIADTNGDIDQVFQLIRDDPEEDIIDRQRAERFLALCLQRRRVDFSTMVIGEISDSDANIDAILEQINEFAGSSDPADKARAAVLTRYAYQAEITRQATRLSIELVENSNDPANYRAQLASGRLRPSVEGFDYSAAVETRDRRLEQIASEVFEAGKDRETAFIYNNFEGSDAAQVVEMITDIAERFGDDESAQALLEYYKLYLTLRREDRREDYETVFRFEIEALRKVLKPEFAFDQGLGTNLEAAKKLAEKFATVILPLYQSLRGEDAYESLVESYLANGARERYLIDVDRLAEQRDLTDDERAYLTSVQALSAFNPYLVAIANANPGLAFAYLESYFTQLSNETYTEYFADEGGTPYFPLVSLGLGPNGVTGLGEIMRSRPDLIEDTFILDALNVPSGPFGVPNGAAWGLNSAKAVGLGNYVLPDPAPEGLEGRRVRDYVGIRWYPGERPADLDTRPGSINTLVDYLPSPDAISDGRYNTNEDLSLLAQLQTAMLARKVQFNSMLLDVEPAPEGSRGEWRVWFQTRDADGNVRVAKVDTDGFIGSFGLGKEYYGFTLDGSTAQNVLDTQNPDAFPKLAPTLQAFKSLANRETESPVPGEVIAIYGKGNSTDTLVEYLGGLFKSNNPVVRNVRKIYVICDGELSKRPRYAGITDLFGRNGRDSIVKFVQARVGDVDYTDPDDTEGTMRLFDAAGNIITDDEDVELAPDHVIAATGFRPELTQVFAGSGAVEQTPGGSRLKTRPLTLPTNPAVAVAETVGDSDNLLITGVASDSGFDVPAKLQQLPALAREALLRNGADNAVAIGFRAPDTQAAVRLFLAKNPELGRRTDRGEAGETSKPARVLIDADQTVSEEAVIELDNISPEEELPAVRDDIISASETLTPLLLRSLSNVRLFGSSGQRNRSYRLRLSLNGDATLSADAGVPEKVVSMIAKAATDPYFQTYARNALKRRRASKTIDINLDFSNGRLVFANSYAQAA